MAGKATAGGKEYISAGEGQRLLQISKAQWYKLARWPGFPARVRLGTRRGVRWPLADVLAWVERRKVRD